MIEAEERTGIRLDIVKFYWVGLRKILWKHSISPQEFFSHVIKLLVTGDQRVHDILQEVKTARAKKEVLDIVHTDEESLYSLIEQGLGRKEG
jgi:hypothetical protein